MTHVHRKHVVMPDDTLTFLETYQRTHNLPSFSAVIEAAALALKEQELRAQYAQYAADYAQNPDEQREAEAWLNLPMGDEPQ
ncbi:hypothetical protein ACFQDE_19990 [Deinococcus caeni]|uniref:Antitoxin n=1 Tax=Deinococcus caeni TaxID=569127 RepID=A0ABP9UL66_9DEIO|nr:hypothetical protein [Deinococcus sp. LM3]